MERVSAQCMHLDDLELAQFKVIQGQSHGVNRKSFDGFLYDLHCVQHCISHGIRCI